MAELNTIIEREESAVSNKEILKYDIEFHSMLYKISGNETMLRFQKLLYPIFECVYKESHIENKQELINSEISHRDLFNSLKKGSADDFTTKMKKHLSPYLNRIV